MRKESSKPMTSCNIYSDDMFRTDSLFIFKSNEQQDWAKDNTKLTTGLKLHGINIKSYNGYKLWLS